MGISAVIEKAWARALWYHKNYPTAANHDKMLTKTYVAVIKRWLAKHRPTVQQWQDILAMSAEHGSALGKLYVEGVQE
jgi:hypothetical protein